MTTLRDVGVYIGIGSAVFLGTSVAFGIAVSKRTIGVAPRCAGRPPNVIYNPNPRHPSQDRGSPTWGWYKWTLGLTYDIMLQGVPGTGTRNDGLDGRMLRVNLDQIVLLRFHAICLRVSVLATLIYLIVILPINITGGCNEIRNDFEGSDYIKNQTGCVVNATDFEKTTIANIPNLIEEVCDYSDTGREGCAEYVARYCVIALCTWVVTFYTCLLLKREWVKIVAMRRKHYLEQDVWGDRKEELEETLLSTDITEEVSKKRDPWIPHPEIRETTPNVQLYSLLIGGLPADPEDAVEDVEDVVAISQRQNGIDWQLDVAKTFFDHCVPKQPGYSSSVAAITILPGATELARTWQKFQAHAAALRRLRFIRSVIAERQGTASSPTNIVDIGNANRRTNSSREAKRSLFGDGFGNESDASASNDESAESVHSPLDQLEDNGSNDGSLDSQTIHLREKFAAANRKSARSIFGQSERNKNYYRRLLGSKDADVEAHLLNNLAFQPEQTASYSRELAQSAGGCCPNGFNERRVRKASNDELFKMEQDAVQAVQEAFEALTEAQEASISKLSQHHKEPDLVEGTDTDLIVDSPREYRSEVDHGGDQTENDDKEYTRSRGERISLKMADYESNVSPAFENAGGWKLPSPRSMFRFGEKTVKTTLKKGGQFANASQERMVETVKSSMIRESCYAVVTFTSRQAAVAARQTLLDGRASNFWLAEETIPVPPLADAAVCSGGRNLCRPVTMSIPEGQKANRFHLVVAILIAVYLFYTIPLSAISALSDPTNWHGIWPDAQQVIEDHPFLGTIFAFLPGLVYTLFFAVLPQFFKLLANFGSYARSVVEAEYNALQMYWWFMNISAFWGATLGNVIIRALDGSSVGAEIRTVVVQIANTIPTTISSTWLFWMLTRLTMSLPLNYQLQFNTYLFECFHLKCLSRANRGGGGGGPTPYRIFIDSGVVFLCLVALAPVCPIIAPVALVNFLYISPLLRRNIIFIYRNKFDAGGVRWPFLFQILVSALLTSHVVLAIVIGLRGRIYALSAAILAALPFPPTLLFRQAMTKKYLRAFEDTALMQASALDGWDIDEETSMKKREEFRRFLVDAHRAAYVPVCVAVGGESAKILTAEPATVVPCAADDSRDIPTPRQTGSSLRSRSQDASAS